MNTINQALIYWKKYQSVTTFQEPETVERGKHHSLKSNKMEEVKETWQEFADRITKEMIISFDYSEQNQIWPEVKKQLIEYRKKQAEMNRLAAFDAKKLR